MQLTRPARQLPTGAGHARPTRVGAAALNVVLALAALVGCGHTDHPDTGPAGGVDAALRAMLPPDIRAAGVLTVATDPSYPPASAYGPDGRSIIGFEPDLGAALGRLLGVRVQVRADDFDRQLSDLAAHRYDAVLSAMTDTADREAFADFISYFRAGTTIVTAHGNPDGIHDLSDLCGHTIAVQAGTVQVGLAQRAQPGCATRPITVHTTASNDDALLALRTGQANAVLTDYPPAVYVTSTPATESFYQLASDTQYEPGLYGIAVAKDRSTLRTVLTAALQRLLRQGTYRQILTHWHVTAGAIDTITINTAHP